MHPGTIDKVSLYMKAFETAYTQKSYIFCNSLRNYAGLHQMHYLLEGGMSICKL
jgi:hypothetical protein